MENQEQKFEHVLTRNFTFGKATMTYTDNGRQRKAKLYFAGILFYSWESDDNNKWIASALCDFAKQMRVGKRITPTASYQIGCLIGYSLAEKNVGRYWHEYNNQGEIAVAVGTCSSRTGRIFNIPGNKLNSYKTVIPSESISPGLLNKVKHHSSQFH